MTLTSHSDVVTLMYAGALAALKTSSDAVNVKKLEAEILKEKPYVQEAKELVRNLFAKREHVNADCAK